MALETISTRDKEGNLRTSLVSPDFEIELTFEALRSYITHMANTCPEADMHLAVVLGALIDQTQRRVDLLVQALCKAASPDDPENVVLDFGCKTDSLFAAPFARVGLWERKAEN